MSLEGYINTECIGTRHRVTTSVKTCVEHTTLTALRITILVLTRDTAYVLNSEIDTCILDEQHL